MKLTGIQMGGRKGTELRERGGEVCVLYVEHTQHTHTVYTLPIKKV
jgi:hypothetical protein